MRNAFLILVAIACAGCEREERRLNQPSPPAPTQFVAQVPLQPGPTFVATATEAPFDDNAYGTSEGERLFSQMNCVGCHAHGGGSMGPAVPTHRRGMESPIITTAIVILGVTAGAWFAGRG